MVEVSSDEITLRVGPRWLRCTPESLERNDTAPVDFRLNDEGTATLGGDAPEEMDLLAERLAREMLTEGS